MSPCEQRRLLDIAMRNDLGLFTHRAFQTISPASTFLPNWHIQAMTWQLEQLARGEIKRLLITLPPRYLKSVCVSVAFPAWVLGRQPGRRIVCLSHGADLASKHAMDSRIVMQSAWYRRAFPGTRIGPDKNRELDFVTTRQGYRFSTSVGGGLTGRGGDLIIIDDPIKPADAFSDTKRKYCNDWIGNTVYSRLDNKRDDPIVVVMQRLHPDDLAGVLLDGEEEWVHLSLPALSEGRQRVQIGPGQFYEREPDEPLHAEREPKEVLERVHRELGNMHFSAQYQQRPVPIGGNLLSWSWFRYYDELPEKTPDDQIVISLDTAYKQGALNDYSVLTIWLATDDGYYLIDVVRKHLRYPDLKREVIEQCNKWLADIIVIEDRGSGTSLLQDLDYDDMHDKLWDITAYEPRGDKVTRMSAQSAKIEAGRVLLPREAPWLEPFRGEMIAFPDGKHDDQVDSVAQFLHWAQESRETFVGFIGLL